MIKLHGMIGSPNVFRVALALEEKGIDYEMDADIASEDFMKKSRFGLMPMLDNNGTYIPESLAILEYLEEAKLGTSLLPSKVEDRAMVRAWMYHIVLDVVGARMSALMGKPDEKKKLLANMNNLEAELKDKTFLVQDKLSMADVALAGLYVAYDFTVERLNLDLSKYPNIEKHRAMMTSREAFNKIDPSEFFAKFMKKLADPTEMAKFQEMQGGRKKVWRSVWGLD